MKKLVILIVLFTTPALAQYQPYGAERARPADWDYRKGLDTLTKCLKPSDCHGQVCGPHGCVAPSGRPVSPTRSPE